MFRSSVFQYTHYGDEVMDLFDQDLLPHSLAGTPAERILEKFKPRDLKIDGKTLITTPVFDAYWYFAAARQNIFFARVTGHDAAGERNRDKILHSYRFTNAYRASDRVSQYLIREIIGDHQSFWSKDDIFFRVMLFKIFNKIETWEALKKEFGEITLNNFDFHKYDKFLAERQNENIRNYSAAYIMPSAGRVFGQSRKHSNHLALLRWMIEENFPDRLRQMERMADGYSLMLSAPSIGPFLAYQFVTDLNYSQLTAFDEMEFVVAGPGAQDGISKCFEDADRVSSESIIEYMALHQYDYFKELGYEFKDLWGRSLQLIDCQNLFCEISKYARVAFPDIRGIFGRSRIKQQYRRNTKPLPIPTYPEKWGINERVKDVCPHAYHHCNPSQDDYSQDSLF